MQAEILLTLQLQQQLFANPRRIALLKQIVNTGSINRGAKLAGISYKSAWDSVNEMNQLADKPLVECATGGKGGGGAVITDYGKRLIQLYDLLGQIQQKAIDVLSEDNLPLDSLLAAMFHFSLQTSARNQWFGTVSGLTASALFPQVIIRLADNSTQIKASVTRQSAQRLGLEAGKEVLVLIKAPWIQLTRDPQQAHGADNQLTGTVSALEQGDQQSEVIISLPAGQSLCCSLSAAHCASLDLQIGTGITAFFNADRVIVATLC